MKMLCFDFCQMSQIYHLVLQKTHTWTGMNYPWSTTADTESVNDINSSMDLLNWSYSLEMLRKYQIYTELNWDLYVYKASDIHWT